MDHVSLMTYDWGPMQQGGGANAPLGWVEGNLVDKLGERCVFCRTHTMSHPLFVYSLDMVV